MATTTNFGWDTPDDTDLVKDGAAAIRELGQDIDTSMADLKGGTTGQVLSKASGTDMDFTWVAIDPLTILDAKGDLISATAADTPARVAVGTNGQVLTADSTQSTGIKWATPASGGETLLSTTTLSGTSTTISISASGYNKLRVEVAGMTTSPNNDYPRMDFNATSNMANISGVQGSSAVGVSGEIYWLTGAHEMLKTGGLNTWVVELFNPNDTTYYKSVTSVSGGQNYASSYVSATQGGQLKTSSAITSVKITTISGNSFGAGQVKIYGVK